MTRTWSAWWPRKRVHPAARCLGGALLLMGAACGPAGRGPVGSPLAPDVISPEEISASSATNAYDLVAQVRPNWLRGRGTPSFRNRAVELPVVYVGDRRQGSPEILRSFATNAIAGLRYINATTATTRYGNGHAGGIIEVMLRQR